MWPLQRPEMSAVYEKLTDVDQYTGGMCGH
jgi:hypothetical protein